MKGEEAVGVLPVVQLQCAIMTCQSDWMFLKLIPGSTYNVRFWRGFIHSHPPSLPPHRALSERLTTGTAVMPPPQWDDRCVGCHDALHDRAPVLFINHSATLVGCIRVSE